MNHWDDDRRQQNADEAEYAAREWKRGVDYLLSHPCPKCGGRVEEIGIPEVWEGRTYYADGYACDACETQFSPTDYAYTAEEFAPAAPTPALRRRAASSIVLAGGVE